MPAAQDFEALIRAAPQQLDHYRAYADWLQHNGDPRGELMFLQVAALGERNASRKRKVTRAAADVIAAHADALLGPATHTELFRVEWRYGFFDWVSNRYQKRVIDGRAVCSYLPELLDHPSSRFLRRMQLRPSDALPPDRLVEAIADHLPRSLASISIDSGRMTATAAEALYRAAPWITMLQFAEGSYGRFRLPALRTLHLNTQVSVENLRDLKEGQWPELTRLHLFLVSPRALPELKHVLVPSAFPRLRELSFGSVMGGDCPPPQEICALPILDQLHALEIKSYVSNRTIHELINVRERLQHLQLCVAFGVLRKDDERALKGAYGEKLTILAPAFD